MLMLIKCPPLFIFWLLSGGRTVYMGISGGYGQIFDVCFLLLSRLFGAKCYIHHHSFNYLNKRFFLTQWLISVAGKAATHIVLCDCMAESLKAQYPNSVKTTITLSNAVFIDTPIVNDASKDKVDAPLKIGFLSNISKEKGIDLFISLIESVGDDTGLKVKALIAGPFQDAATQAIVMKRVGLLADRLDYIGPQYGSDKDDFLASLDVLVFPTPPFVNEAAPLVIYEALSQGTPVIAIDIGCIKGMIDEGAGIVVIDHESFQSKAIAQLMQWNDERDRLYQASQKARASFLETKQIAEQVLEQLCLDLMQGS